MSTITVYKVYISTTTIYCPFCVTITQLRAMRNWDAGTCLTGHFRTGSTPLTASNAVINTATLFRTGSMTFSCSQVQDSNNHLAVLVPRVDLAEKFSNPVLIHTFKSFMTFYFNPSVRHDRGSFNPFQISPRRVLYQFLQTRNKHHCQDWK